MSILLGACAGLDDGPVSTVRIDPDDDLAALAQRYSENTRFVLAPGTYRLDTIRPKNGQHFIGEDGAVLSGARPLTEFVREGRYWVAEGQTQSNFRSGQCRIDRERCTYAEDLFIDDQPLRHVGTLAAVTPGAWHFDDEADRAYFMDDPTGRTVEIGVINVALESAAQDVVIRNLTFEKYAGTGQVAAVRADDGEGWLVEDSTFRLNHGVGLSIGNHMIVRNNRFIQNGQLGVSGIGDDSVIEGNEIAFNNYAGFDDGWEAGGAKFVLTKGLIVRGNYVHHNDGPGLWTDIDNVNTLYENNLVVNNANVGILHEVSYDAVIRNNVVRFNHPTEASWLFGGQIVISSSRDVEIYENDVVVSASGGNAVTIVNQDRGVGLYGPHVSYQNRVHHNRIVHLARVGETGVATDDDFETFWRESDNRFDHNRYFVPDIDHSFWGFGPENRALTWWEFLAHGQEANGSLSAELPPDATITPAWSQQADSARTALAIAAAALILIFVVAVGITRRRRAVLSMALSRSRRGIPMRS